MLPLKELQVVFHHSKWLAMSYSGGAGLMFDLL